MARGREISSHLGIEDAHIEHVPLPEAPPPRPKRYIANARCSIQINGVTVPFAAGTVISDESMIVRLLDARANISPIMDEGDLGTCPHCGKSFSLASQRGASDLLARARQLMPGMA